MNSAPWYSAIQSAMLTREELRAAITKAKMDWDRAQAALLKAESDFRFLIFRSRKHQQR